MRKLLTFSVILMVSLLPAFAQEGEIPQIRPDHPRIFFNSETLPIMKERANGSASKYYKRLLKDCDAMTDNPVASGLEAVHKKEGLQPDGTYYSLSSTGYPEITEFGKQAAQCALAWNLSGNPKYLEKAKKMLGASIYGYTVATENRRPVAWRSHSRINALCAYDWIYNALTPEERKAFIVPLMEHVRLIQPEVGLKIPRQPGGGKHQGFYGTYSLLWYSGLAGYGDGFCDSLAVAQLKTGLGKFREVLDFREASAGDDGGLSTVALNYALGNYPYAHFNFFRSYLSATGKNIAEEYPHMGLFPYFVYWTWIRDAEELKHFRIGGAADCYHAYNQGNTSYMYGHFINYINLYSKVDPDAAALTEALLSLSPAKGFSSLYPAEPFLSDTALNPDPALIEKMKHHSVKARHFEVPGQILMRSDWTPDATYCCFTAGGTLNEHRHFDENNFTIYKYDHLALDTGERGGQNDLNLSYWFSQSVAHNVVLIQDPSEPLPRHWGPKTDDPKANINYGGQTSHAPSNVLAFETNDVFTYVASDAAPSYGPKAKECVRQFVYVYPDYFIVYDRVESSDAGFEKDWLLHFKNEPLVKGNLIRADSDAGRLFCQNFLPEKGKIEVIGGPGREFWVRDRNFEINPKRVIQNLETAEKEGRGPYTGSWRIEEKPSVEGADTRFLNVITVGSSETMKKPVPAKYLKDATRDGVSLKINGKKITVWFNREGAVGGSIAEGRSPEKPLATTVQPQSGAIL